MSASSSPEDGAPPAGLPLLLDLPAAGWWWSAAARWRRAGSRALVEAGAEVLVVAPAVTRSRRAAPWRRGDGARSGPATWTVRGSWWRAPTTRR